MGRAVEVGESERSIDGERLESDNTEGGRSGIKEAVRREEEEEKRTDATQTGLLKSSFHFVFRLLMYFSFP